MSDAQYLTLCARIRRERIDTKKICKRREISLQIQNLKRVQYKKFTSQLINLRLEIVENGKIQGCYHVLVKQKKSFKMLHALPRYEIS